MMALVSNNPRRLVLNKEDKSNYPLDAPIAVSNNDTKTITQYLWRFYDKCFRKIDWLILTPTQAV